MDYAVYALGGIATLTLLAGSRNHLEQIIKELQPRPENDDGEQDSDRLDQEITTKEALAFPVVASILLVALYYITKSRFQVVVTLYFVFVSAVSVLKAVELLVRCLRTSTKARYKSLPQVVTQPRPKENALKKFCGKCIQTGRYSLFSYFASLVVISTWVSTGHWFLNNIIGVSLCMLMIESLRLPSLKVGMVLLWSLFLYDVFWVFYSSVFFSESVMVAVATTPQSNPIQQLQKSLDISFPFPVAKDLQMPLKLMIPAWDSPHMFMLGLGDIAIPGVVTSFFGVRDWHHRRQRNGVSFDVRNQTWVQRCGEHLFRVAVVGYVVGLYIAMLFATYFNVAQPALLYIVPSTTVPCVVISWWNGTLKQLWESVDMDAITMYESVNDEELPEISVVEGG